MPKSCKAAIPTDPGVLELLAQAQLANEDKAAALESYKKLAAMRPEYALAQLRIASIYAAMENPSAASDALKKALAIKPDYVDAQLAQTALEVRKGNHEQALAIARQIQKQQGKSPVGYIVEGDLLMKQKEPAAAAKAYEQAFALSKSGPLLTKLHASLQRGRKRERGNFPADRMAKATPCRRSYPHVPCRNLLWRTAEYSRHRAVSNHCEASPEYMPALNNLAWLYRQEKDPAPWNTRRRPISWRRQSHCIGYAGWILVEQGK